MYLDDFATLEATTVELEGITRFFDYYNYEFFLGESDNPYIVTPQSELERPILLEAFQDDASSSSRPKSSKFLTYKDISTTLTKEDQADLTDIYKLGGFLVRL